MLRVGLTGGIACGKSRVLRRLRERGCRVLDLDAVARNVTAVGEPALAEIVAAFGPQVADERGALDRRALAAIVFDDARARDRLEAIVHPRVRAAESEWAAAHAERPQRVLVADGAVLIEAGMHLRYDRLVVVHCPRALQLTRLLERDGLDQRSARARLDAQLPAEEKRAFAHLQVDSSGSLEDTDRGADGVFEELQRVAQRPPEPRSVPTRGLLGALVESGTTGPRGLSPLALLQCLAERDGIALVPLARRLSPPSSGPWYRAALDARPGRPATALSAALVAGLLLRHSSDPEVVVAAAASLARLTHRRSAARADACALALLLRQIALEGALPGDLENRLRGIWAVARRWGGGEPSAALARSVSAAGRCRHDRAAAGRLAAALGGEPQLARTLVGMGLGTDRADVDPALHEAVSRLGQRPF